MADFPRQITSDHKVRRVSRLARRERPGVKMQPPLIPMIDVTFLLLLYFLLTTTFRQAEGQIPGSLPRKMDVVAGISVPLQPICIVLRPAGEGRHGVIYEMSGLNVGLRSPQELYERLIARQRAIGSSEAPVLIQPRPDVRWQHVVEAFNQAVRAKFKKIGFASTG